MKKKVEAILNNLQMSWLVRINKMTLSFKMSSSCHLLYIRHYMLHQENMRSLFRESRVLILELTARVKAKTEYPKSHY
jgi:hypothetical protein